jgi:hypothetical protein
MRAGFLRNDDVVAEFLDSVVVVLSVVHENGYSGSFMRTGKCELIPRALLRKAENGAECRRMWGFSRCSGCRSVVRS